MSLGLRHVGFVVDDMNLCRDFFVDLLGFTVVSDELESGLPLSTILELDDVVVHTIKLKNKIGSVIELLKFHSHGEDVTNSEPSLIAKGLTHIAIEVKDIYSTYEQLASIGYVSLSKPTLSANNLATLFFLKGPENLMIEFVQINSHGQQTSSDFLSKN